MDHGYPPEALAFDPLNDSWTLHPDFTGPEGMWYIETAEDAADLAEESWDVLARAEVRARNQRGAHEPLPLARLRDSEGAIRAEGILSGDLPLMLQRPGARAIRIDRMEIDGVLALYVPSEALAPGRPYTEQRPEMIPANETSAEAISAHNFLGTGAMIATNEGPQAIDWLRAGDMVLTRDNGYQPIVHLAQVTLPRNTPLDCLPLCVPGETFGTGLPTRELTLTPGSQILLSAPQLELWFGETEMFARVDQIGPELRARPSLSRQTLWSIILSEPEVILAEGLWLGSALASPAFLDLLPARTRTLIEPVVAHRHRFAARACLKDWETAMFTRKIAVEQRVAAA